MIVYFIGYNNVYVVVLFIIWVKVYVSIYNDVIIIIMLEFLVIEIMVLVIIFLVLVELSVVFKGIINVSMKIVSVLKELKVFFCVKMLVNIRIIVV